MKEKSQENPKEKRIHIRVSMELYKEWKEFFDKHDHNLTSGIKTSISFYRKWMDGDLALLGGDITDELTLLREEISEFESKTSKKSKKIKQLDYDFPEQEVPGYEDTKNRVIKKLQTYGNLSTPYLAQLLDVPGPAMLMVMKRIISEKNARVYMNENFEWCMKDE